MFKKLLRLGYREPDFVVGDPDDPYMLRWWVIPRNKYLNIYFHKFLKSDDDRALHDHPWTSLGVILWGKYMEEVPADRYEWITNGDRAKVTKKCWPLVPKYRDANYIHRVVLYENDGKLKPVYTLFITGPWLRKWGFWCPFGFRSYKDFVSDTEKGNHIGKGCAE